MNRLLLIAYYYPPLSGPAVQRPIKTVKYLTQLGWEVDVITVSDIIYHSVDYSLTEVYYQKRLIRTPSLDPLYLMHKIKALFGFNTAWIYQGTSNSRKDIVKHLFPIDEKVGWLPFLIRAGLYAIRTKPYNAIMVTCNPFSSSFAGVYLARKAQIPLILDYRDHWTLNNAIEQPKGVLYKLYQFVERYVLNRANLITTATDVMKDDLIRTFGENLKAKIMPFYNGWDEDDFKKITQVSTFGDFVTISYLGTLYRDRKIGTFLQAVKELLPGYPQLRVKFIGNFYPDTLAEINSSGIKPYISIVNQMNHSDALQTMCMSDILLLIVGDERLKWVLTGKLFEYLRTQKPIVALAPKNGEAAKILLECGHSSICDIHNPHEIKETLVSILDHMKANSFSFLIPYQYERKIQVNLLANRILKL